MIFGGFMVHDKIIKLLWKRFNTVYKKHLYIVGCVIYIHIFIYYRYDSLRGLYKNPKFSYNTSGRVFKRESVCCTYMTHLHEIRLGRGHRPILRPEYNNCDRKKSFFH